MFNQFVPDREKGKKDKPVCGCTQNSPDLEAKEFHKLLQSEADGGSKVTNGESRSVIKKIILLKNRYLLEPGLKAVDVQGDPLNSEICGPMGVPGP
jgi:hypothetical protein